MRRIVAVVAAGWLLLATPLPASASPRGAVGAPTAHCAAGVFTKAFADGLRARHPGRRFTAAVYDTRSGCWYHLNRGLRITTASVIKAHVLGAVLLKAQREGRHLTEWERARIDPMIRYSFNSPWVSDLYSHVGGVPAMSELDRLVGATATSHTTIYGATVTTAEDRTRVALALFAPGSVLREEAQAEAWGYMTAVHPTQRWGITAGVPLGWTVALKNGFYPTSGAGWRLGSSGFVRRDGTDQGYAVSILTDQNVDHAGGQRLVEAISRRVAQRLTVGPHARRPVDRAACTATFSGESWTQVTARLGLPSSSAGEVQTVAGGNSTPLSGQRACSPVLRPEPTRGSTVRGTYQPVVTDLTCDGRADILWYGPGAAADALWRATRRRRFEHRSIEVRGSYVPIAGDFDGDGCGDVVWWGPGAAPDGLWAGRRSGGPRWSPLEVPGRGQHPVAGDVDGDRRDDIVWYLPGDGVDRIWFGRTSRGRFGTARTSVGGAFEPVVGDLGGNRADDVLWYAPGPSPDHLWFSRIDRRARWRSRTMDIDRRSRVVAGDFGGDGDDELVWYGPGGAADRVWTSSPPRYEHHRIEVRGDFLPLVGDFDGDGRDDLAWYGPGGMPDALWWGRGEGRFREGRLTS